VAAESALEKTCRLLVESHHGRFWKWTSPGTPGVPDRIMLLPGLPVVFVELKSPSGSLSRIQKVRIQWLRAAGFQTWVVDDYIDFAEAVESYMEVEDGTEERAARGS
jgi:hypothetical protein